MSWREIKTADVKRYFTPAEQATLANIMGNADTISDKITDAVGMVRGFVAAGANPLDGASLQSVPDQLRTHTIAYIAWEWLTSFPALKALQTDKREKKHTDALTLFERIGSQEKDRPRVEQPAVILNTTSPVGSVVVARRGRHHVRHLRRMGES